MAGLPFTTRDMMIRTIWGEARSEGPAGQAAVAHVIFNRQYSGLYPDTAEGVMQQRGQFSVWNFSNGYAGGEQGNAAILGLSPSSPAYQNIGRVVDGVADGSIPDNTGGALNYYNPNVSSPAWGIGHSGWSQGPTIGGHTFGTSGGRAHYDFTNPNDIRAGGAVWNNPESVMSGGRDVSTDWQSSAWANQGLATETPYYGSAIGPFGNPAIHDTPAGSLEPQSYRADAGIWNDPISIQPGGNNAELTGSQPPSSPAWGAYDAGGEYSMPRPAGESTAYGQFRDPYHLGRGDERGALEGPRVGEAATPEQTAPADPAAGGEAPAPSTPAEGIGTAQEAGAREAGTVSPGQQGTPGSIPQAIVTGDNQVATATANAGKAQAQAITNAAKQASQTQQTTAAQQTSTVYNLFLRIMIFIVGALFLGAGLFVLGKSQVLPTLPGK